MCAYIVLPEMENSATLKLKLMPALTNPRGKPPPVDVIFAFVLLSTKNEKCTGYKTMREWRMELNRQY